MIFLSADRNSKFLSGREGLITGMATLLPPPSKRQKLAEPAVPPIDLSTVTGNVLLQFKASDTGETTGSTLRIPAKTTAKELELLLNQILNNVESGLCPANIDGRPFTVLFHARWRYCVCRCTVRYIYQHSPSWA
jgi:hypothetical protein